MTDDPLDEFLEYDFIIGADSIKCPHCGATISRSLLFEDDREAKCPKCGKRIEIE
jgi:DNA-directed RNA polymerase subunit RPC12/RpoP